MGPHGPLGQEQLPIQLQSRHCCREILTHPVNVGRKVYRPEGSLESRCLRMTGEILWGKRAGEAQRKGSVYGDDAIG